MQPKIIIKGETTIRGLRGDGVHRCDGLLYHNA